MTELGTAPSPAASESDEQALLQRLRNGEDAAFGELFELHAGAVRRLAQSLASDRSEAEDITAETFFRVLQALRRGAGPRDYVRAYLLTVARRVSWEWHGARRDVPVSDDELTFRAGAGADTDARTAEHTLITTAFTSLPERWRTVLWQTEVEGEQPAMVAPHFGLSANATAALARRARQGLRAAYLQAHLSVNRGPETCRSVVEKLGGFTAGSVTGAEAERIKAHLLGCASCRATQDELRDVCSSLRAHAEVLVVAVPALAGLGKVTGVAATVKSVLLGSKVKVGLALASTAAAGAVGFTTGPLVLGTHPVQDVGLHGGAPELALKPPDPPGQQPPPQVQHGPRVATGQLHAAARPQRVAHHTGVGPELKTNDVPKLPDGPVPGAGNVAPPPSDGTGRVDLPGSDPSDAPMSSQESTDPRADTESDPTSSGDPTIDGPYNTTRTRPPSYVPPSYTYVPPPETYLPPSVTTTSPPNATSTTKTTKTSTPTETTETTETTESTETTQSSETETETQTQTTSTSGTDSSTFQDSGDRTPSDVTGSADSGSTSAR
ncbi:sigma-70 family RNA polymerase sigma factor [Amycolatopsis sp. FDAARGOS 1241]|uniref:sigma factor n=1 Tax=Amycolatopsis sp. FDAARGOS 1241 TaxID=2778070 RepID=UPI00195146CF|nr:sigma-70 family RNA polymerase sigma factor [Amycolatopsis sp. FDAARGOS 1241]QRP45918.1 sigma-70 family RNA polymerase sigma factor [Amycolatopsis sp. FDAARGOS 1241]